MGDTIRRSRVQTAIPERPVFGRHLAVDIVDGEGVVLRDDQGVAILASPLQERLAREFDGTATADEIVDRLSDDFDTADLYYALMSLTADGHLVDANTPHTPHDAFWHSLGQEYTARSLASVPLAVIAAEEAERQWWTAELLSQGATIQPDASLALVLTSDYLDPSLGMWNAQALEQGRTWLLARAAGPRVWIGPLFVAGESCCWECLRHGLDRNQPVRTFLRRRGGMAHGTPRSAAPWTRQAAAGLVETQLARLAAGSVPDGMTNRVTCIDTVTLAASHHHVSRRPQCPACGDATLYTRRAAAPLTLSSREKRYTADGGHRVVSPAETLARFSSFVDPLVGVVSELTRVPNEHPEVHVYTAGVNGVHASRDLTGLSAGLRRASSGKGFTDAQARASALGEAIERYSSAIQGDEPRTRTTLDALGDAGIHPNRVMLFSESQYDNPPADPEENSGWDRVSQRFGQHVVTDWSPIWSLTESRTKYLPTNLLYLGGSGEFAIGDSNGNAAGNTIEEAVLQGFLELVERDSTAMWWYNRSVRQAIDLDSLDAPEWTALRAVYERLARETWLLDITSDLGIPSFVAVSRLVSGDNEEILLGLGAHLDARIAASRALSEMNQMLAALGTIRSSSGVNATLAWWLKNATIANQPYLAPLPGATRSLGTFPRVSHPDLRDDVLWCQQTVELKNLEMLVLDHTRPDIEVPVVKVVVPGLRHFRRRLAPGRLYDVPVKLGWTTRPTTEPAMNPAPFFL